MSLIHACPDLSDMHACSARREGTGYYEPLGLVIQRPASAPSPSLLN